MQLADRPVLVLLVLLVAMPLAAEAAYRLSPQSEGDERASQLSSATLALLGLLIAFTFAMAAERFETRRSLVVDEANAISTTYLRYQLLDEPYRSRLNAEMATYVATRLAFASAGVSPLRLSRNLAATSVLQDRIWADVGAAVRTPSGQPLTVPVLTTTNEMFDLAASRAAAAEARVPRGVRLALVGFAILAAASVGSTLSAGWRRRPAGALTLFVLIALAAGLIADLDQPGAGIVRVPQDAMQHVADQILRAHAAARNVSP